MSGSTELYFDILLGEGADQVNITEIIERYRGGVTKIDRGLGGAKTNTTSTGTDRYGTQHAYQKLGAKTIKIDFLIFADTNQRARFRREMTGALDFPNGTRHLRFEDEPNGYYDVISEGQFSFTESLKEEQASGTISFTVPDGLWHSDTGIVVSSEGPQTEYAKFTKDKESKSIYVELKNPSNVESYPIIRIKNKTNIGWIGIVNQNGVMELGSSTSTDAGTQSYTDGTGSETLIQIKRGDFGPKGWGLLQEGRHVFGGRLVLGVDPKNDSNSQILNHLVVKEMNHVSEGQDYTTSGVHYPGNDEARSGNPHWAEAIGYIDIPADRDGIKGGTDFRVDFNAKFHALQLGKSGVIRIGVLSNKNEVIAEYELVKNDTRGNDMYCSFMVDEQGDQKWYEMKHFHANDGEYEPANRSFNTKTGDAWFMKEGSKLTFFLDNHYYNYTNEKLKTMNFSKIVIQMGHYYGVQEVEIMCLESLSFTKLNTRRYALVDNKYKANSIITIDNWNGEIWLSPDGTSEKGYVSQSELVKGSNWITLPKGKSKLQFSFSPWMKGELPEIEIEFNEQYLQ
jgi:putative phage tail component, N-terminal domain protein|nr:MAG TPA: distal tail protein [Caudoviricetes sp.]